MSTDQTSERIKRAALVRFVDVGFGSATVDQIAAEAGVGVATLYRRWPDKAAIANELMSDYLDVVESVMEPVEGGTRKARFLTLWNRLWEQSEADPAMLLFVEAQAHAGFMSADVAARKGELTERVVAAMADFGVNAAPDAALAMITGTLTAIRRAELQVDRDDLGERLWAAVRSV